jgi:hypothetical protein
MVALVEKNEVKSFCEQAAESYAEASGLTPEIYPIRTVPGAGILG